jgi:hypothetical protein
MVYFREFTANRKAHAANKAIPAGLCTVMGGDLKRIKIDSVRDKKPGILN